MKISRSFFFLPLLSCCFKCLKCQMTFQYEESLRCFCPSSVPPPQITHLQKHKRRGPAASCSLCTSLSTFVSLVSVRLDRTWISSTCLVVWGSGQKQLSLTGVLLCSLSGSLGTFLYFFFLFLPLLAVGCCGYFLKALKVLFLKVLGKKNPSRKSLQPVALEASSIKTPQNPTTANESAWP